MRSRTSSGGSIGSYSLIDDDGFGPFKLSDKNLFKFLGFCDEFSIEMSYSNESESESESELF